MSHIRILDGPLFTRDTRDTFPNGRQLLNYEKTEFESPFSMVNNAASIMHLFHEYSLSQPHIMCRYLRLICCTIYVLGFKEGSRMESQFIRQND
ncbi:hypothetical protein DPMN_177463 [Dreissena polymorpha]|uniref:Uncharacterized protein n=1 Tax=Dreissena polymorpha TaxID=45954 RepID=A0A9D4EB74_DREPO|nr:hypothetical protein DPMN_177463 [Dreissena polymorpha]